MARLVRHFMRCMFDLLGSENSPLSSLRAGYTPTLFTNPTLLDRFISSGRQTARGIPCDTWTKTAIDWDLPGRLYTFDTTIYFAPMVASGDEDGDGCGRKTSCHVCRVHVMCWVGVGVWSVETCSCPCPYPYPYPLLMPYLLMLLLMLLLMSPSNFQGWQYPGRNLPTDFRMPIRVVNKGYIISQ